MTHGQLQVIIVEGRNLKDKDTFGQNDAYIELYLDKDYKQRTSTKQDTNSPVWNETFHFNLLKGQDHLKLKVYDEDIIGKDSIGSAKVNLKDVFATGHFDQWVKLPAHLGLGSHGEIHIIINYVPHA
ncbi:unnamed protein product [Didymodactylos carnosus]|uniref:C2 domain-containing protein n=1 Tax=Didymodactylos carnosus TaxID=1234261 RepID=A0A813V9C8_9BILA|nr:unnamed protein product [Didymodactylos carnosus]CAF3626720.1 unnamed protein product [Didymodactylos carnosus]